MARKRQDEKDETAIDMVSSLGFSPIGDGTYTNVKDFLPTFIPQWDYLLGGGIPFGRLTEIYADNAVGKSTLLIHLNRVANALGTDVFWIDTEETSDGNRMESLGIDQNHTFIFKPQKNDTSGISIEKVGKVIENIINKYKDNDELKDTPLLVIWDSLGGTNSQAAIDAEIGENKQRGRDAGATTEVFKKLTPMLKEVNIALVVINQVRANQNKRFDWDPDFVSSGGKAFGHFASLRLALSRSGTDKGIYWRDTKETEVGHGVNMKVIKSKQQRSGISAVADVFNAWVMKNGVLVNGFDWEYNIYSEARGNHNTKGIGTPNTLIKATAGYKSYTRADGTEIKKYEPDFIKAMKDDPTLTAEIFDTLCKDRWDIGHPRYLDNEHINCDVWPGVKEIREYFNSLPEEQTKNLD